VYPAQGIKVDKKPMETQKKMNFFQFRDKLPIFLGRNVMVT